MVDIRTISNGYGFETDGMVDKVGFEISATVSDLLLNEECHAFIEFVVNYISSGNVIRSGETLKYGYWLTKAMLDDQRGMRFLEYNPEATEFILGINLTLSYWKEQHEICKKVNSSFTPPRPDQMIVISDGVYEGDSVEGVRYPSPDHMSGWWFTTDKYNGDVNSLKTVHAHHVSAHRPDLAKFFALPYGYRFFSSQSDVWFDQKVANAKF